MKKNFKSDYKKHESKTIFGPFKRLLIWHYLLQDGAVLIRSVMTIHSCWTYQVSLAGMEKVNFVLSQIQRAGNPPYLDGTCDEYAIEITYNTTSFIYTNLLDFEDINNGNPNITLLKHYNPDPPSDGVHTACFEGFLTVPNTVFTLAIVNINNPNDILATTTFTLDQTVSIGNPTSQRYCRNGLCRAGFCQPKMHC